MLSIIVHHCFVERSAFYLWVFPVCSLCLSCSAVVILYLMIRIVLSISAGLCLINYGKFSATISFNIAFPIFYSPPPRIPTRCTLDLLSFSPTIMNFLYIFYNLVFIGYILDKLFNTTFQFVNSLFGDYGSHLKVFKPFQFGALLTKAENFNEQCFIVAFWPEHKPNNLAQYIAFRIYITDILKF